MPKKTSVSVTSNLSVASANSWFGWSERSGTGIPEIFVGHHWKRCCPGIVAAKTKPITTRRPTLMLKELDIYGFSTCFRHVALRFCLVNRSFRTSTLKKLPVPWPFRTFQEATHVVVHFRKGKMARDCLSAKLASKNMVDVPNVSKGLFRDEEFWWETSHVRRTIAIGFVGFQFAWRMPDQRCFRCDPWGSWFRYARNGGMEGAARGGRWGPFRLRLQRYDGTQGVFWRNSGLAPKHPSSAQHWAIEKAPETCRVDQSGLALNLRYSRWAGHGGSLCLWRWCGGG